MSQGNKRATRAKPEEAAEKPPEQEDELKAFIEKCVMQSQAVLLQRMGELERTMEDMKTQHQEAIDNLEIKHAEEIAKLTAHFEKKIEIIEEGRQKEKTNAKFSKKKLDKIEQYGRRMNVRVPNVPKLPNETNDTLKTQLVGILTAAGAKICREDIKRCHRSGKLSKPEDSEDATESGQCILRVCDWSVRESLHFARNKCRQNGYGIRQDLTKKRLDLLSAARYIIDGWEIPEQDEQVYAYANINCELVVRRGKFVKGFATNAEMREAVNAFKPQ